MEPTPEWIVVIAPFISGAAGVGFTAGLIYGKIATRMNAKFAEYDRWIKRTEDKLELQVGEFRCDKMRETCQKNIAANLIEMKSDIKWLREQIFTEIARFIAQNKGP